MSKPHFGHTRHGLPVHLRTIDHHPAATAYQRFNKRVASWLVTHVGTMTCFWLFLIMTLTVLPAVLYAMGLVSLKHLLPAFVLGFGFELLATWLLSTCFQLILLPGLMVGQNLQSAAADARSAKQFEDTEILMDRMDTRTQGGLTEVLAAVGKVSEDMGGLATALRAVVRALPPAEAPAEKTKAATGKRTGA